MQIFVHNFILKAIKNQELTPSMPLIYVSELKLLQKQVQTCFVIQEFGSVIKLRYNSYLVSELLLVADKINASLQMLEE